MRTEDEKKVVLHRRLNRVGFSPVAHVIKTAAMAARDYAQTIEARRGETAGLDAPARERDGEADAPGSTP
jgi:hypothetical protein